MTVRHHGALLGGVLAAILATDASAQSAAALAEAEARLKAERFAGAVAACLPAEALAAADGESISLGVLLDATGALADLPVLIEPARAGPEARRLFRAATDALEACAPYTLGNGGGEAAVRLSVSAEGLEAEIGAPALAGFGSEPATAEAEPVPASEPMAPALPTISTLESAEQIPDYASVFQPIGTPDDPATAAARAAAAAALAREAAREAAGETGSESDTAIATAAAPAEADAGPSEATAGSAEDTTEVALAEPETPALEFNSAQLATDKEPAAAPAPEAVADEAATAAADGDPGTGTLPLARLSTLPGPDQGAALGEGMGMAPSEGEGAAKGDSARETVQEHAAPQIEGGALAGALAALGAGGSEPGADDDGSSDPAVTVGEAATEAGSAVSGADAAAEAPGPATAGEAPMPGGQGGEAAGGDAGATALAALDPATGDTVSEGTVPSATGAAEASIEGSADAAATGEAPETASRAADGGDAPVADGAGEAEVTFIYEPARTPEEAEAREGALELNRRARREIQRRLTLSGHSTRGVDGVFGPNTRTAISAWQGEIGMPQTGFIDDYQREILAATTSEVYAEWTRKAAERRRVQRAERAAAAEAEAAKPPAITMGSDGCPRYPDGSRVPYHSAACDLKGLFSGG